MTEARRDRLKRSSTPGWAPAAALLVLATLLAGCGGASLDALLPVPTETAHENMPLYAAMWITTDPVVTRQDLRIEMADGADGATYRTIDLPAGTLVQLNEVVGSGSHRVTWLGGDCTTLIDLPPERTTGVVLDLDAGCEAAIGPADLAEIPRAGYVAATVTVQPWPAFLVRAIALDDPPPPLPDPVPPDEGGLAQLMPLWAGRYEIQLVREGVVLERKVIEISGDDRAGAVELTFDGIPD